MRSPSGVTKAQRIRNLQSDRDTTSALYRVSHLVGRVLGSVAGSGIVVLTDDARDTLSISSLRPSRP